MSNLRRKAQGKRKESQDLHQVKTEESMISQVCKLHIKVLAKGKMLNTHLKMYNQILSGAPMNLRTEKARAQAELLKAYHKEFGHIRFNKAWITAYQRNVLLAFADFIDNPLRCHNGRLAKLQYCKSIMKGLQEKQRVSLIQTVTTLFSAMNIETGCIGQYLDRSKDVDVQPLRDEQGNELLMGLTHLSIRNRFAYLWGHSISKTKYFDCLRMLKSCEFFDVTACYISNKDADVIRAQMRENGASIEELEAIPRVYSAPAYKNFTEAFFSVFKEILDSDFMRDSKAKAKASRIEKGLSLVYAALDCVGNVFVTKRNKFLAKFRYPQGFAGTAISEPVYH